jgi:hypothetical protein
MSWLASVVIRVIRPLRSTGITRRHHYYEAVRPCASPRYSAPCGVCRLGFSLSPLVIQSDHRQAQVHTFPAEAQIRLTSALRRTPPGQQTGIFQAAPEDSRASVSMSLTALDASALFVFLIHT